MSLWRNGSFVRLWLAQVVSNAGSQITNLALPLTAVLALGATPAQMGSLGVASSLPNLFFGLLAGVWVDRSRRRPLLVGADLGRALLIGTIPAAALLGSLTFAQLYLVAFASATLSLFFTIASVAVLPSVVRKDQLVEANSTLAATDAVLAIAGPSAAGGLIQVLSAPKAIVVDAVSYVLSALSLRGVGISEAPPSREQQRSIGAEIGEGVRELVRTPLLLALTVAATVGVCGAAVQSTVFLLFVTRELGLSPATIGLVYAAAGLGSLLGAVLAACVARSIGTGPTVILGQCLWAISARRRHPLNQPAQEDPANLLHPLLQRPWSLAPRA
jgi:MFS family permease